MRKFLSLLLLFMCGIVHAQTTNVTATITDSSTQVWSNGTYTFQLMFPAGYGTAFLNGTILPQSTYLVTGTLDSTGSLAVTLNDNSKIAPSGTFWRVTICSNTSSPIETTGGTTQSVCFSKDVSVSGTSVSLTSLLSSSAPLPVVNALLMPWAYNQAEVSTKGFGGMFWDLSSSCVKAYNGSVWSCIGASSGFSCPTPPGPGILYWNGLSCLIDLGAQLDGSGNITLVNGTFSGAVNAASFNTTGPGGILSLALQNPPGSVPSGTLQVYGDLGSGLIGCRNNALTSCMGSVQIIATGSTVLPATLVTANGGCNLYTSTATGASSTNAAIVSVHGVDVTGVSGYAPGQLWIYPPFVSTNLISFKVCNPTTSNITPASLTVFWNILPQ